MKTVAVYGNDGSFIRGKEVSDNYQLANGETFSIPDSKLLNPKFNGVSWVGLSQDEFNKATINENNISTDPSIKDMVQRLGLTIAQLSASQAKIEQQLGKLTNGGATNA
ncbi:hypothetical protein RAM61_11100 [Enterococcus faecium]|nr:hypothetical protein [Enterococcus faecium]